MSTTNENMNLRRPDGTQRVVITGMGAVTPAGVGVDALWDAVMGKQCCIAPIERFDTSEYEVHNAGEVRGFDATEHGLSKKEARRFERFVQYAMVAADEAMAQAGLSMDDVDSTRVAIAFGTGIGGIDELQKGFETLHDKGPKRVSPLFVPTMIGNIAAGNLADGDTIPQDIRLYRELEKGEYLLRVNGHSMEPSIPDGSVVIMKKYTIPPIPKPGTIVQYHDERGVTLKKLVRRKNPETGKMEYTLHPINPAFGDIEPMDGGKISALYVETLDRWEKA